MKMFIQGFYVIVHELQEGERCMYAGWRRQNHICTHLVVGTFLYTQVSVEQSMYGHRVQ
jgi:hypothetical protein